MTSGLNFKQIYSIANFINLLLEMSQQHAEVGSTT